MSGVFRFFDFTKPGPGVPKNAPPKPRIILFFEVFFRKFWNLIKINLIFFMFNLPALVAAPFLSQLFMQNLNRSNANQSDNLLQLLVNFAISSFLLCIPIVTVGPAQAGFTYVLRNYAREEHAFIWGDFKEQALKNMKQSIAICLIDIVIVFIIAIEINFYLHFNMNFFLQSVLTGIIFLISILYIMMHLYIYPMMVTFKLSIMQIYKNALIFALIKFFPNLGIIVLCFILAVLPILIQPVAGIMLFVLITMSTIGLITNFYVYPCLKKYVEK